MVVSFFLPQIKEEESKPSLEVLKGKNLARFLPYFCLNSKNDTESTMPRTVPWEFVPLTEEYPYFILSLETSEVFVLWSLGLSGPMSIGEFYKSKKRKLSLNVFPCLENITSTNEKLISEFAGNPYCIDRSSLLDTLKRLTEKGLVEPIKTKQRSKVYSLTLTGIVWYFYHFWCQDAFKLFYEDYFKLKNSKRYSKAVDSKVKALEKTLPFIKDWEKISKEIPDATQIVGKAINNIHDYSQTDLAELFNECSHTN